MTMSLSSGRRGAAGNVPKGYAAGSLQQYTPGQMDLHNQQFGLVGPESQLYQQAQGNDAGFSSYEDYANRQFQNFSGQNASRFSGASGFGNFGSGGMSARRGSGFQNQQTQGAEDFASQLAMQRQGLQRQALQDLMGMSNTILRQQPNQNYLVRKQPEEQSFWSKIAGAGLPIAGGAIGGAFGGPAGAAVGSQLGGALAQGFQPTQW